MMWSIYDKATGIFSGVTITCGEGSLDFNVPDGSSCLLGSFDCLSQRFDEASGDVVDYVPAAPGEGYTWDAAARRWTHAATDQSVADYLRQFLQID